MGGLVGGHSGKKHVSSYMTRCTLAFYSKSTYADVTVHANFLLFILKNFYVSPNRFFLLSRSKNNWMQMLFAYITKHAPTLRTVKR